MVGACRRITIRGSLGKVNFLKTSKLYETVEIGGSDMNVTMNTLPDGGYENTTLKCNPSDTGFAMESGLFGINIEITRKGLFGGLSAQMLNNRKLFMGQDTVDGWTCEGFERITDRPEESLCQSNFVILNNGSMSQTSEIIALQKRRTYEAKVWIKAYSETAEVTFGVTDMEQTVTVIADNEPYKALSFVFDGEDVEKGTFFVKVSGEVAVYEASLMPTDHFYGMRWDVIECLRAIAPPSIRYPGGCYADHFEWRESLKAPEFRKPIDGRSKGFMLRNSYHQDCVEVGLNEFIRLCKELAAEPEYTVSHLQSDGEDARCLIEYCNGHADTEYGAMREAFGLSPFGIKVWYIGNESYYSGGPYRLDGGLAAERTNEIVHNMRQVDPDMKAVIGLVSDRHLQPWSKAFMEKLACPYEYVSHHWYYGTGPTAEPDGEAACEHMKHTYLHDTEEGLEFYKNELLADTWDTTRICVDEWNFCWGSGSNNALLISNALQLHFFARNAEKYHIREARFFMPINEGMITVLPTDSVVESSGELFRLMAKHMGGTVIACAADTEQLDILCTKHDGNLYVSIINRSDIPFRVSMDGYEVSDCTEMRVGAFSFYSNDYEIIEGTDATVQEYSVSFITFKSK